MIFSIIELFPLAKHRHEVIEILQSVQNLTRPAPGCVDCWVSDESYLDNHVRYGEQWESVQALQEHIRSELYRRVMNAMEFSRHPPAVDFYFCQERKGMELIEDLRCEKESFSPAENEVQK